MDVGATIKIGLLGDRLWAQVTRIEPGVTYAELRNESIHEGISWGDEVMIGEDGYTVIGPKDTVMAAHRSVARFREAQGEA